MAQYGDNNENRSTRYGSSGQSGSSSRYGSSGGTYQSGYRGDNRTQSDRYGQGSQYGQAGQHGAEDYESDDYGSSGIYGSGGDYGSGGRYGSGGSYESGSTGTGQYSTAMQGYGQDYGSASDRSYSTGSSYGATSGSGIAIEETHRLIGSDKVEGTAVYDRDGTRIGTIHNFMVDKRSGKAEYAVMSFGGFLGMGQTYYPLPWQMLDYDTDLGGFRVEMDEEDLDHAPSFRAGGEPEFDDQYGRQVYNYYGLGF